MDTEYFPVILVVGQTRGRHRLKGTLTAVTRVDRFVMNCAVVVLCLFIGCATAPDKYDPRNPGDHCLNACPDGLVCTGVTYSRTSRESPFPGRCELQPGRCATNADCRRSARCVRTSERMGLCAEAPQL